MDKDRIALLVVFGLCPHSFVVLSLKGPGELCNACKESSPIKACHVRKKMMGKEEKSCIFQGKKALFLLLVGKDVGGRVLGTRISRKLPPPHKFK